MQRWMVLFCLRHAGARQLWWLLGAALALCCCLGAHAATDNGMLLPPAAHPDGAERDWSTPAPILPLTSHVRYFKETPGQPLDWQQAQTSPHWQPSNPKDMAALYGATTLWMRVDVTNNGPQPITRLVALDQWTLQDVQLWVLEANGQRLLSHQRSGQALKPQERAIESEVPVFSIPLAPGQHVQLLLRVSDQYWSHIQLDAWESSALLRARMLPKLGFAAVSGAALALCVVLWLMRSKLLAITSVWVLLSLALELTFAGLVSQFLPLARELSPGRLMLAVGWMTTCASAFVTMYFMGLERHPFWRRWNWGMVVVTLVLIGQLSDSDVYLARQTMLLFTVVQVVSNMLMLAWAKLRGYPWRQWMVALMIVNFLVAFSRVVLHQFYVEPETYALIMNGVLAIKAIRALMVVGLVALQRNSEMHQVRQRLHEAEHQQRQDLQAAVEQRTIELRQALVTARDANSAKTDFLARVSHDLRSPLTSINGYAQLLQRTGGRTAQLAQTIRRSAEHMQAMVNDLIDYARGGTSEQPELRPTYIHAWLDEMVAEATALTARQGNRFALQLESELPPVLQIDARRLRRILSNLLENACKFTHQGTITLSVSAQPLDERQLQLCLAVSDNGPGIDPAEQAQLFEPFFRGANAGQAPGMGLGLSIVGVWAQRLGGTVQVHSVPDMGTTFTLRIPAAISAEKDMASPLQSSDPAYLPPLDGKGRDVWVVEDNADIRDLLAQELIGIGFTVQTSHDGADFIARMRAAGVSMPSLVLTDHLMPGADGSAVLRAVRAQWPGVPVVLLSATQKTMQALGAARDDGFDASLMKPLNLADLRVTLAGVLRLPLVQDTTDFLTESLSVGDERAAGTAGPHQKSPPQSSACLDANELERILQWADMGALTDLTEWAEGLPGLRPECTALAARVLMLLSAARLDEVRALCEAAAQKHNHD